ncbi:hypothetical protein SKAU_G00352700 [Synaphobranchus kaupii]|uniref:Uncharacterized protein n=1 Tax=Synaphobranchus kaupii TaxID=118154 RepID=A0A9Q1II35_SYNKA|nr:hypothetical protein SKAU_G00352700 [Synaphobranchus kaupii]
MQWELERGWVSSRQTGGQWQREECEQWQMRIEDNIAVTADGVELLTCVPHAVEIEQFMVDAHDCSKSFSPVVSQNF